MTQSRSIPIAINSQDARDEEDQRRNAKMADFQDYIVYSRIVDGMKRRQSKSRCIDLRYQNQALIDHITYTRKAGTSARPLMQHSSSLLGGFQGRNSDSLVTAISKSISLVKDDEEEMMFELEI